MPRFPGAIEREVGSAGDFYQGGLYWDFEETPELQWPNSIIVFDQMRRTDSQCRSVLRAMALPIRGGRWSLHGSDVRPEVMKLVRAELGLGAPEQGRKIRDWPGVKWDEFLRHALLHVPLGFMAFEQVYIVGPPGEGLEELGNREVAHIRKLSPRLPRFVSGIDIARDGGLVGIRQMVKDEDGAHREAKIETARLVFFVHEQEGAEWTGSSILRSSYKHWLIKDGLLRIGPLAAERNGMGLPVVTYPRNGNRATALGIARSARAGEDAGVALPQGYILQLLGVTGSTRSEMELLKYHDEAIGRNALAMLLDLGHDAGARSLGDTFLTFFLMTLDSIAGYIGEIVTEHVIADLVRLNFGPGETYPVLRCEPIEPKSQATSASLKELVDAGILIPDDELEVHERRRRGLPIPPGLPTEPLSENNDGIDNVPTMPPGPDPEPADPEPLDPGTAASRRARPARQTASTEELVRRLDTVKRKLAAHRAHPANVPEPDPVAV